MLADEIAEGRFLLSDVVEGNIRKMIDQIPSIARSSVCVNIKNIEDYARRYVQEIRATKLPCIAPPFPNFILESNGPNGRWAALCVGHEFNDIDFSVFPELEGKDPRWDIELIVFSYARGFTKPIVMYGDELFLNPDGLYIMDYSVGLTADKTGNNDSIGEWMIGISCLAISFMHCKNVIQHTVDPPPKLSKRHKERHGRPLFSYRVLEIEPMKQVLRSEGHSEEIGLAKALHICRGHFKDYRERGLFGKNKGLYWWDQYARGSIEMGVAAKDYAVKAPPKSAT